MHCDNSSPQLFRRETICGLADTRVRGMFMHSVSKT